MPSQNRRELTKPLLHHEMRDASTLIARQFTEVFTASGDFPDLKDTALVDATSAEVLLTLPLGTEEIIGLPYGVIKSDSSSNAAGVACAGSDTFADSTTSLKTTSQHGSLFVMWDGSKWRRAYPSASSDGGAGVFSGITSSGALLVTTGGARVNAGGMRIDAGGLQVLAGAVQLPLTNYADDAAAGVGGLTAGQLYRTAGAVMVKT